MTIPDCTLPFFFPTFLELRERKQKQKSLQDFQTSADREVFAYLGIDFSHVLLIHIHRNGAGLVAGFVLGRCGGRPKIGW